MRRRGRALALLLGLVGCQASAPVTAGEIDHVVLLWLKAGTDSTVRDHIVAAAKAFPGQIEGIKAVAIGGPVPSDRDQVDDSFDLGLVMRFRDEAALAAYLVHPVHVRAKDELLVPNVARLLVYDVRAR